MTPVPSAAPMLSLRTLFAAIADPAAIEFGPPSAQPGELRRLRQRDERAWQDLFEREWTDIYRYAHARTASTADAEDLTARVFEEAWKHIDSVEDRGLPARAWLFGIARHVVASHRRKLLRRPPIVALEAFDGRWGYSRWHGDPGPGTSAPGAETRLCRGGHPALPARPLAPGDRPRLANDCRCGEVSPGPRARRTQEDASGMNRPPQAWRAASMRGQKPPARSRRLDPRRFARHGDRERHSRPPSVCWLYPDATAVGFDDAPRDAQSKPAPPKLP